MPESTTTTKRRSRRTTGRRRPQRTPENSDVLVSAVISTYLLTHLHHVLQRAEYGAAQEGRNSQAANYAQLRKVLCMDARSMDCLLYTSPSPRDLSTSRMPSSA